VIYPCGFESDRDTGMRVVLLPEPRENIATDAAPCAVDGMGRDEQFSREAPPVPVLELGKWATQKFLQPSAAAMREADLIASFYAGVPHEVGRKKHEEFLQRKIERSLQR
jgi:hypothetical protein